MACQKELRLVGLKYKVDRGAQAKQPDIETLHKWAMLSRSNLKGMTSTLLNRRNNSEEKRDILLGCRGVR
jgi:hypothetical protein